MTDATNDPARIIRVLCAQCQNTTKHDVLHEEIDRGEDEEGQGEFWWDNRYRMIRCGGCNTISFQVESTNSENVEEQGYYSTSRLYPPRVEGVRPIPDAWDWLPYPLWRIHTEVVHAMGASAPTLAAVGMRSLVEGICKQQGATGGSLPKRIHDLVTKGVLPAAHEPLLHHLCDYGNDAVHELKEPSGSELSILFRVIDQLLRNTYELPHLGKQISRRKQRAGAAGESNLEKNDLPF